LVSWGDTRFVASRLTATRRLFIAREVHGVLDPALRDRTHVLCIVDHGGQRHRGADHLPISTMLHAFNPSAAAAEVAQNRTGKFLWRDHLDRHQWL
jgi:hypothetical protein